MTAFEDEVAASLGFWRRLLDTTRLRPPMSTVAHNGSSVDSLDDRYLSDLFALCHVTLP
jgi:hypothetical protein